MKASYIDKSSLHPRELKSAIDTSFEEGEKSGEEKGKIKGKLEMAKNLKKSGVSIDIIAESSRLSKEEIEKL